LKKKYRNPQENPWEYLRIFLKTPNPQEIALSTKSAGKSLEIPAYFPGNLKFAGNSSFVQNPQVNP
jgi:hypothetical protein